MRLEDRIRNELHDTAERLALDPGEYRRAIEGAKRRRQRRIIGALSGMVLVAGLVVIVLALRPGDDVVVAPSTTTTPATTAPSPTTTALPVVSAGAAVVAAGPEGISWTELGADGTSGVLESDPYYEAISWVASDGEGGLVFTHEVSPLPWDQGTLLWLSAGAAAPRPLAAPPAQGMITPIGVDRGRVYYRLDSQGTSEVIGVDLDGQNREVLIPATQDLLAASLDGPVLAVVRGVDCTQIDLFMTVDGHQMPDGFSECYPASINDVALSDDSLYVLEDGPDGRVLRHLATSGEDLGASRSRAGRSRLSTRARWRSVEPASGLATSAVHLSSPTSISVSGTKESPLKSPTQMVVPPTATVLGSRASICQPSTGLAPKSSPEVVRCRKTRPSDPSSSTYSELPLRATSVMEAG